MKAGRFGAAIALLVTAAIGMTAAGRADAQNNGSNTGGSVLGAPIVVPPPPSVAAIPAQPLMPSQPGAPQPAAPRVVTPQFGPPGGAEPILGTGPGEGESQPAQASQEQAPAATPQTTTSQTETPSPAAPQPAASPPQNIWLPRQNAILGVLDKESGAVSRVAVQVGNSVVQGNLRIKVLACVVRPADQAPDAAVFLNVQNSEQTQEDTSLSPQNADNGGTLFSGWLLRAEPGASVVSDARDTFRLIGCDKGN